MNDSKTFSTTTHCMRSHPSAKEVIVQMFHNRFLAGIIFLGSLSAIAYAEGDSDAPEGFQWRPALAESLFAFTIAHIDRYSFEQGTRDATASSFWRNYARDVQAFHGWDDGDGFKTSYIAHPMEGGMAGFIERQNDPKYRNVE